MKNFRTAKQRVKTAKGRTNSSVKWLRRNLNDPYVQLAKQEGYISRAAFKILEIDEKFRLIRKATSIVDLGAAPGGWLQAISQTKKSDAHLVGVDLQAISLVLPNAVLIQGDFLEVKVREEITKYLSAIDLVVSDMAVASSGSRELDHLRNVAIIESVILFLDEHLIRGGSTVIKFIRGSQETEVLAALKAIFRKVKLIKPEASYSGSAEIFIVGLDRR